MNAFAIYFVSQHLADLHAEAVQARLARQLEPRPSVLRRAVAAVRSAFTARTSDPATAPAAS